MSILKINGVDIPAPLPFSVEIADQDVNSDTDANANLHRNRVNVKRKIALEWGPLSWADISKVLTAMEDVYFDVWYPDPKTGKFETKRMYAGNRTAPICYVDDKTGELMWAGLQVNITEQ